MNFLNSNFPQVLIGRSIAILHYKMFYSQKCFGEHCFYLSVLCWKKQNLLHPLFRDYLYHIKHRIVFLFVSTLPLVSVLSILWHNDRSDTLLIQSATIAILKQVLKFIPQKYLAHWSLNLKYK